jgi:hypothetical protein
MALQLSVAVRNAQADSLETAIGTAPRLQLRTGAAPANCAAASTGTLLADLDLASDWLGAAASGVKTMSGTITEPAVGTGTAAHFRVMDSAGTTCHMQGTVTATGGGGDAIVDNTSLVSGQNVTLQSLSYTRGNA